jgi:DNA polymerase-3 subunit epsilon/exodeoxyribonuclease X
MLIFLDMQTTGVEVSDVICAIALINDDNLEAEFINEGKKIPPIASSMHNVTNEMIQNAAAFKKSGTYELLVKHNTKESVLVTHNAKFHLQMLSSHGLDWHGDVVDTMRVCKHLMPECELFSLPFLRYELKLYKEETTLKEKYGIKCALFAHDVKSDVIITKLLFEVLSEMTTLTNMKELSFKKVLLDKLPFGKYQGRYIEEILELDRNYLQWMLQLTELDEDLRYSLEYYL